MRRARLLLPMLAALSISVACTDDDAAPSPTTAGTTTSTTSPTPTTVGRAASDGVLTIGLLVPRADDSQLGRSLADGAERARQDIENAGRRIRIETFIEDDSANDVAATIDDMRDSGVDAVVGPASSTVAIKALDSIVDRGMVACSPTASAMLLDDFPDRNMFFRSIPSDSLQAKAIAELTTGTGGRRVSIAFLDDMYGRDLFNAVNDNLSDELLDVAHRVAFPPAADSYAAQVDEVLRDDPEVIIVLADADTGPEIISEIGRVVRRQHDGERRQVGDDPWIIVNDAIRRPAKPALISGLPTSLRKNLRGVSPNATPPPDSGLVGPYSVNAYDCVTALALASAQARSDQPADIAAEMVEVSSSGQQCRTYGECADLLDLDLNIDYDGPSGVFELSEDTGDPIEAQFEVFGFDVEGVDVGESVETVS